MRLLPVATGSFIIHAREIVMRIMPKEHLSIDEIEELGYYDFMGYMDVPFFNVGGAASIDRLAEISHINQDTKILVVGCGTGGNSCYLANRYRCTIVGIDIPLTVLPAMDTSHWPELSPDAALEEVHAEYRRVLPAEMVGHMLGYVLRKT